MRKVSYDEFGGYIVSIYNWDGTRLYGECICFRKDGSVWKHIWMEDGKEVEDFLLNPSLRKSKYNLE